MEGVEVGRVGLSMFRGDVWRGRFCLVFGLLHLGFRCLVFESLLFTFSPYTHH